MALWGAEVKAGQDFIHNFSPSRGRLRVTKATLGTQNNLGWSTLEARASDERRATLCTLHPMSKPMCGLELELEEENSVTFFVNGPNSICLSGYYIRAKAPTCTTTRHALLKGTHQEILDRSGDSKKARRDDGKTCHDSNDHESDNQERNDAYKKTNAAPPSPFPTKNTCMHGQVTVVKNPNGTSSNNIHQRKSESDIHEISDDEKGPTSKAKEEAILKVETITKGRPDAKVATVGSKVRVKFVGHLRNGDVFDSGGSYQFKLGAGKVIRGWDLGIKGMLVGEERKLTIPPSQGYGDAKQDKIPPNSCLIYTIKLLEVEQTKRTRKGSMD